VTGTYDEEKHRLRARVRALAARIVQSWATSPDLIHARNPVQRLEVKGPAWATFRTVETPDRLGYPVTVGPYSGIHWTATFIHASEHRVNWVGTLHAHLDEQGNWVQAKDSVFSRGPISVGGDVWIGFEAVIVSGVTIGDGAVIAARALVLKDVEPYAIIGGNPGKVIGYRFEEPIREALLRIRWWDWSDAKVRSHASLIESDQVQEFVDGHDPELGPPSCEICKREGSVS
jgi:acetyltransferase-like isoleucine patch superfamily enzyme